MKIIFLDIDGVLNSGKYVKRIDADFDDPKNQMDPEAVIRLNSIADQTGASIVVTSTWRKPFIYYFDKLRECIASYGITAPVVGYTPDLASDGYTRTEEILYWLEGLQYRPPERQVESFVVLDDETIDIVGRQVKTDFEDGLQDHHVRQAVSILGPK